MQEIFYIRTLVDLCGVLLLYSQQDERQKRYLANEMAAINEILSRQYHQYEISRNNIEVLNQKYHDLKHQILAIRQEKDVDKKEHYLLEMEKRIKMYESEFKTGNHVLDTLLTSKSMYCTMNNINFTCMADGTLLEFMDIMDICSIFGNALDNAIESVEKQTDIEKRVIKTTVYAKNQFIMIRFENYSEEMPVLESGLPHTTKKDTIYHGFGLKSIHMITQKYGGTMTIKTENNWFILRILIPMPVQ
jgi:sensor histidine kinase regulating citrate/malate metabolism